ncbi:HAD family hydrolase [Spirulina sp. CCNP1310]|uniref:HAD family hydrolase n=1 Tax=Spirulina sp. CCNP1310 TaxID=3110249 RepID=UPI002B2171C3|nr:HAD hydrolase-like protein [Spirulina sp. CCNP1310]
MSNAINLLQAARLILWDFDGVIKDSVTVKSIAFEQLFLTYGSDIAKQVRVHHENHGGISRYDKIPIYLAWAGEPTDNFTVEKFCKQFSQMVQQAVIDSPWVPGVENYLRKNPHNQIFILVTATPQAEIETILSALHLRECFTAIYGSPVSKKQAIQTALETYQLESQNCVMIGDTKTDWQAALANNVPFLFRCCGAKERGMEDYRGESITDFTHLVNNL